MRHEELSQDAPRCGRGVRHSGPMGGFRDGGQDRQYPPGRIQPEAFALIAMMTPDFTLGVVLLAALVAVGLETTVRRLRLARA